MFQVNQKVWDVAQGVGIVLRIEENAIYAVYAKFTNGKESTYTIDGKFREEDENPSLYPHPVEITKKFTKPSINWEHVDNQFNYLAEDPDGTVYLYEKKPYTAQDVWGVSDSSSEVVEAFMFASYVKGTCDWRDSLIQRPKGDSHGN